MTINVTEKHINESLKLHGSSDNEAYRCPIALAIKELTGKKRIAICANGHVHWKSIGDKIHISPLPENALQWIGIHDKMTREAKESGLTGITFEL